MDGGAGIDTLTYATSGAGVIVTLNLAAFGAAATGADALGDTNKNFENLIGSSDIDALTGNSLKNVIEGGFGADKMDGGAHATGGDTLSYVSRDGVTVTLNLATFVGTPAETRRATKTRTSRT
jgi:hypothetical protein